MLFQVVLLYLQILIESYAFLEGYNLVISALRVEWGLLLLYELLLLVVALPGILAALHVLASSELLHLFYWR